MTPANHHAQDLEQNISWQDEKHPHPTAARPSSPSRMPSVRRFLCGLLLVSLLAFTLVSAIPNNRLPLRPSTEEQQKFQDLLETIESTSLHDILHKYASNKYQHGVYQEDRKAMAAIHLDNAAEASSLIELAKRQASNSTTSVEPTTSTVVETTQVSTVSTVIQTTTPVSTQESVTPTATPTSQATSEVTTPVNTPTTQATTPVTTPTTAVETPTTSAQSTAEETTAETPSSTATTGPTTARTTTSGTTTRATTTRARSTSSRTTSVVFTTTLADGAVSTVTSVTVVAASTIAGDSGDDSATATGTGAASLQTNGAQNIKAGMVLGMIGVLAAGVL